MSQVQFQVWRTTVLNKPYMATDLREPAFSAGRQNDKQIKNNIILYIWKKALKKCIIG